MPSQTPEPRDLLGLLAEEDRLRVVAALALGAVTQAEVASRAGLSTRSAARALGRLVAGGLVDADRSGGYRLHRHAFKEAARRLAGQAQEDDWGTGDPSEAAILRRFLVGGRLVSMPAQRSKRRMVLDHLARVFEPGRRYPEREVDALLRAFHPDHATLRRYLVDEGFLNREAGVYWRTGGTFEVD